MYCMLMNIWVKFKSVLDKANLEADLKTDILFVILRKKASSW